MQRKDTMIRPFRTAAACLASLLIAVAPPVAMAQTNNAPDAVDDMAFIDWTYHSDSYFHWYEGWDCFSVLPNDSDPDQHTLTVTGAYRGVYGESGLPGEADVFVENNGDICVDYYIDASDPAFPNYIIYVYYTISDGHGGEDTAMITVYFDYT